MSYAFIKPSALKCRECGHHLVEGKTKDNSITATCVSAGCGQRNIVYRAPTIELERSPKE